MELLDIHYFASCSYAKLGDALSEVNMFDRDSLGLFLEIRLRDGNLFISLRNEDDPLEGFEICVADSSVSDSKQVILWTTLKDFISLWKTIPEPFR